MSALLIEVNLPSEKSAMVNEAVWRNFSENRWTDFKVFGILPLTLLFTALQAPLIQRHSLEEPEAPAE